MDVSAKSGSGEVTPKEAGRAVEPVKFKREELAVAWIPCVFLDCVDRGRMLEGCDVGEDRVVGDGDGDVVTVTVDRAEFV
jgi:hypothetical protein